jgi:hypothetical protein
VDIGIEIEQQPRRERDAPRSSWPAKLIPGISKADGPKKTFIYGSIQLPDDGDQEAVQAKLATIPVQTANNTPVSSHSGTVLRAELQKVKVDAGNGSRMMSMRCSS